MSSIKTIANLLRDELSATETYQQVLDKLREDASLGEAEVLYPIYENHKEAVSCLQSQILELGVTPSKDTGVWGAWTKIVLGSANLLGKQTALMILQEGEKTGSVDYEQALLDKELPLDFRALIETKLLPNQHSHIRILEHLWNSL
jgi:hypothetical protein